VAYTQRIPLTLAQHAQRAPGKDTLRLLRRVELVFRTREEADDVADLVAGFLPDPVQGRFGLIELLLNAIEHGNLAIGGARKAQLLREHRFEDEVAARFEREPFSARRVHVAVTVAFPTVDIEIRDDGDGFAWRAAVAAELDSADSPNGRGIALISRTCFPSLHYRDPGNIAVVRATWSR
jgi:anti-sigma regulatory factor (Ser/Thr protein kinase)